MLKYFLPLLLFNLVITSNQTLEEFKKIISELGYNYYFLKKDTNNNEIIFNGNKKFSKKLTFGDCPNDEAKGMLEFFQRLYATKALFIYSERDSSTTIMCVSDENLNLTIWKTFFESKLSYFLKNNNEENFYKNFLQHAPTYFEKKFKIKKLKAIKNKLNFLIISQNKYVFTNNKITDEKYKKLIEKFLKKSLNKPNFEWDWEKQPIAIMCFCKKKGILCDGVFSFLDDHDAYYLNLFSTNNPFIGLGIGKALLTFSIKYLFLIDDRYSKVGVDPFLSAEGFYENFGFKKEDIKNKYFRYFLCKEDFFKNNESEPPVLYKRELNENGELV